VHREHPETTRIIEFHLISPAISQFHLHKDNNFRFLRHIFDGFGIGSESIALQEELSLIANQVCGDAFDDRIHFRVRFFIFLLIG
jgi:hypothetical protein